MWKFSILAAVVMLSGCGRQDGAGGAVAYDFSKDPHLWLEEVEGGEALA